MPRKWRKTGKLRWVTTLVCTMVISVLNLNAQDDVFTASVNQKEVAIGDRFKVTFKLKGEGSGFQAPDFRFFKVIGGPSRSTQVQIINGNYSRTESYSYVLRAEKQGNFEIGKAKIKYKGKTLTTEPLTVKVLEKSAKERREEQELTEKVKEDLFIRCFVDNTNPYKGEQITATFKLYVARSAQDYSLEQMPQYNGFWAEPIVEPKRLNIKQEVIDGKRYKTALLRKTALFPQKSGKLKIDPMVMDFKVRVQTDDQERPNDIRSFFKRRMGGYETKRLTIQSKPVQINVRPLPQPQPDNFNGLVGKFDLSSELNKTETKAGNPVNFKLSLSGSGNLKMVQSFDLNFPPDFEVYDPEENMNLNKQGGKIGGAKSLEYLIIPRQKGEYKIDPVELSYFDPELEEYKSLSSEQFTLQVEQGEIPQANKNNETKSGESVEVMNQDIRYIKTEAGNLRKTQAAFVFSPAFWTLTTSPFLLMIGLFVYKGRRQDSTAEAPNAASKKARQKARQHLKQSTRYLSSQDQEGFFESLSDAAWGYASDKLDIPLAELTKDRIREAMAGKLNQDTIDQFIQLLNTCEQARFAPSSGSFDMNTLYEEAKNLITQIEDHLKQ